MSTDPIERVLSAFAKVLVKKRIEHRLTVAALAQRSSMTVEEIDALEDGSHLATIMSLFRLAWALGENPAMMFIDVVAAWREESDLLYKSRPSDFQRLYRLGWLQDPGDFRELPKSYEVINHARDSARQLNTLRAQKSLKPIDTICIYIRLDYVSLRADAREVTP